MELTDEQLAVIAYTLLGEAAGEGRKGMEAVAHVIFNRAESGRFPANPAAVAVQQDRRGVHQFSAWNKPSLGGNDPAGSFSRNSKSFKTALEIVQEVARGDSKDPTGGATHYYAHGAIKKPRWFDSEAPKGTVTIGGHTYGRRIAPDEDRPTIRGMLREARREQALQGRNTLQREPTRRAYDASVTTADDTDMDLEGAKRTLRLALEPKGKDRPSVTVGERRRGGPPTLNTRTVQTVPVDPRTGTPTTVIQMAANREAARLRTLKQGAVNTPLQTLLTAPQSGSRGSRAAIEEQRTEQQANRARPTAVRPTGVTRVTTTVNGRPVQQSGTAQLPPNVRPTAAERLTIPKSPPPVTRFAEPITQEQVEAGTGLRLPGDRRLADVNPQPELEKRLVTPNPPALGRILSPPTGPTRGRGAAGAARRKSLGGTAAPVAKPAVQVAPVPAKRLVRREPVVVKRTPQQVVREELVRRNSNLQIGANGYVYRKAKLPPPVVVEAARTPAQQWLEAGGGFYKSPGTGSSGSLSS